MKARILVVCGGLWAGVAALAVPACSETAPDTTAVVPDAGADVVDSGSNDAATAQEEEDAATCDLSADFTTKIPDASLADGASTTGLCVQCANETCSTQVSRCNADCDCQGIAAETLDCFVKNPGNPLACAGSLANVGNSTRQLAFALVTCISAGCSEACATDALLDGGNE
ncbi:MAG TPA: hypothetical protein VM580_05755 [Labilithrix sp.]|jgi:hypothetical protein|nr:hypothetical protein [Labilithrix sp.]